jgi:hypothetical protein
MEQLQGEAMRVIVCGSRGWSNRDLIAEILSDLPWDTTIVQGGAKGADRIAKQEAEKLGFLIQEFPAEWNTHGKRAGLIRNETMAMAGADLCLAFWDGRSTGTQHMTEMAAKYGIPIRVVHKDFPNRERVA